MLVTARRHAQTLTEKHEYPVGVAPRHEGAAGRVFCSLNGEVFGYWRGRDCIASRAPLRAHRTLAGNDGTEGGEGPSPFWTRPDVGKGDLALLLGGMVVVELFVGFRGGLVVIPRFSDYLIPTTEEAGPSNFLPAPTAPSAAARRCAGPAARLPLYSQRLHAIGRPLRKADAASRTTKTTASPRMHDSQAHEARRALARPISPCAPAPRPPRRGPRASTAAPWQTRMASTSPTPCRTTTSWTTW